MHDQSPYENYLNRTGMVCIGQVVAVDAPGRRLRCKTIGINAHGMDDLDLYNVRILHGLWHAEGDDEVRIPRTKSYGVILFVGTEPIWLGSLPLDISSGEPEREKSLDLNPGDYGVQTVAGNKVIVRTGGTLEVQSTQQCRTFWIPSQNLMTSVCQNFELEAAGGTLKWTLDKETEDTTLTLNAWNSLTPTHKLRLQVGKVDDSDDLLVDVATGPVDDKLELASRAFQVQIKNNGSMFVQFGDKKAILTIDSETGNTTFTTEGTLTGTVKKDVILDVSENVKVSVKKDVTMSVDGSVSATVKKDFTANVDGKASIISKGAATVQTDADAKVDAKGSVNIKSGGAAEISAGGSVNIKGSSGVTVGSASAPTNVDGQIVNLAGGGTPIARVGDQAIGVGNMGAPVVSTITAGSPKVTSA